MVRTEENKAQNEVATKLAMEVLADRMWPGDDARNKIVAICCVGADPGLGREEKAGTVAGGFGIVAEESDMGGSRYRRSSLSRSQDSRSLNAYIRCRQWI